jgi:hypothetical protein
MLRLTMSYLDDIKLNSIAWIGFRVILDTSNWMSPSSWEADNGRVKDGKVMRDFDGITWREEVTWGT